MRTKSVAREAVRAAADVPEDDELWTTAETAAYLRRPEGTLRQWRHRGVGPKGFRCEGLVLYRRSEVLRWLAEQERAEEERTARDGRGAA